ncbi:hypothetical protein P154DRAFT_106533 [Amniculicola lignicola CBS 123094]|uniref:F-box domain-containing protein n=1 Tax=Amniculicola lignicola CBS 123094 TaxID=1392246 RepID=A0A6A5VVL3_9PLEO|nr:hypothetical protein P154DRAFT_106533 [Amniculicola lignicola CBS 123094]
MSTQIGCQSFRLLDLPRELRLMIYERLPCKVHNHLYRLGTRRTNGEPLWIIFITKSIDIAILATCRQVRGEAQPMVVKTIENSILKPTVKMIISTVQSALSSMIIFPIILRRMFEVLQSRGVQTVDRAEMDDKSQLLAFWVVPALGPSVSPAPILKFFSQAIHQLEYATRHDTRPSIEIAVAMKPPDPEDDWRSTRRPTFKVLRTLGGFNDPESCIGISSAGWLHLPLHDWTQGVIGGNVPQWYEPDDGNSPYTYHLQNGQKIRGPMDPELWATEWME